MCGDEGNGDGEFKVWGGTERKVWFGLGGGLNLQACSAKVQGAASQSDEEGAAAGKIRIWMQVHV